MTFLGLLRFAFFLALFVFCGDAAAEMLSACVVRVNDGDTLALLVEGNVQQRIRPSGIDCPSRKQAFGTRAKEALSGRVGGGTVTVAWNKPDRYKRIVGKVIAENRDVNLS